MVICLKTKNTKGSLFSQKSVHGNVLCGSTLGISRGKFWRTEVEFFFADEDPHSRTKTSARDLHKEQQREVSEILKKAIEKSGDH